MALSHWILAVSVLVVIFLIALGIGWWIRNRSIPTPAPPTKYSAPLVWRDVRPGPDASKNTCQLYQFPTTLANIGGITIAVPGIPTFDSNVLNKLNGSPNYPNCLDSDQVVAQQLQHTCQAPQGVVEGSITRCFLLNGGVTGLGGNESYFTNSGCFKVPTCPGQLSLVSVNYQGTTGSIFNCIQNEGINTPVAMNPCDPSNLHQLFRVTRINPGQDPNTLTSNQGQNGLIAQIYDRDNNLCLMAGTGTTETTFVQALLNLSGCSGADETFSGTEVVVGSCTGPTGPTGDFSGYVWALLPSISYCGVSGGCGGCTGCPRCVRIPGSNSCTGCTGCTGFSPTITPPQIAYIGNLNFNDIPIGPTGYQGITGPSAIFKWLIDNNTQSLYFGGRGGLILRDLGLDVSVCNQKPYISQYINLTLYNTIKERQACICNNVVNGQCVYNNSICTNL